MSKPTRDFAFLWNDLPYDERMRLMPAMAETQKLHIWQCKQKAIKAHKKHISDLDDWMNQIDIELSSYKRKAGRVKPTSNTPN